MKSLLSKIFTLSILFSGLSFSAWDGLDPKTESAIQYILEKAEAQGHSKELLERKIQEGLAKGKSSSQILKALEQRFLKLQEISSEMEGHKNIEKALLIKERASQPKSIPDAANKHLANVKDKPTEPKAKKTKPKSLNKHPKEKDKKKDNKAPKHVAKKPKVAPEPVHEKQARKTKEPKSADLDKKSKKLEKMEAKAKDKAEKEQEKLDKKAQKLEKKLEEKERALEKKEKKLLDM